MDVLFSWQYYMALSPGGDFLYGYALLLFFVLLFFSKKIVLMFGPKDKYFRKSLKKNFWYFSLLGALGTLLVVTRFAEIPYFSMRLWLYLVFFTSLFFLGRTIIRVVSAYKKRLASVKREKSKNSLE